MPCIRVALALALLFIVPACTHTVGRFPVISTRDVRPSRLGACKVTVNKVTGEDTNHIIVVVPTRWRPHDMHVAIDRAIGSVKGGVAMVGAEIKETKFHIPFIYGYYAYHVEGKVLVDPALIGQR